MASGPGYWSGRSEIVELFHESFYRDAAQHLFGAFCQWQYGIMQGDLDIANSLIVGFTVGSMLLLNFAKGKLDERE